VFPLDLAVSELKLVDRRIFTGIVRDISERLSLEQEILRISEQERRRIGQDLHDGLGQMLTGIGLIAQNLARRLDAQGAAGADEVAEITELIQEADQQARGLARGLIPVDLEATGLSAALRRLAVNAERLFDIHCTLEEVGAVLVDDNSVATHLFRIAQEAVSNAVKHGRAGHVRISLASGARQVRLRIHDDGVGFPESLDEERRGMGVRIMHYRARVIGATLDIAAGVDGGTTVTCTLRRVGRPIFPAGDAAA
jgi:signal transduction histidine kinase